MTTGLPPRLLAAQAFARQGRLAEAVGEARAALAEDPGSLPAGLLLAALLFRTGRLADAARPLVAILERQSEQPEALGLLAAIRKAQGDLTGAIELYQSLIRIGRGDADVYNGLGACWLELEDAIAAGNAFKRAIELDRTIAHSYYNLGMALSRAGRSFETFATFRRGIELAPSFHDGYVQLWQQARELLNWKEALPILESGLRRHPDSVQMRVMLAATYGKVGRTAEAETMYREARTMDPAAGPPYAHWLNEEGRFDEAAPILEEAIRANPIQGLPYYGLTVARRFEVAGTPLVDLALPLVGHKDLAAEEQMYLRYALAKAYEGAKDYERAMRHYDAANHLAYGLYNAGIEDDVEAAEAERATLARLYPRETIERLDERGSPDATPIWIVGMIRTGTTLLDQILASHPQTRSAGELPFWGVAAGRANRQLLDAGTGGLDLQTLAWNYRRALWDAAGDAGRIVDKMPTNFSHLGLMSATFPKAKIVHLRRNPLDTVLSVYTTFLGKGTGFAYRQENIVAYYREYLRAMEHWRTVLPPGRMIEIDYEDLVSDKERVLRAVVEFLNLPWDDALLSHHERRDSQVSTPSLWTARQPVNTGSVARWRRYEPWLGRLLDLKDAAHPPPTV